MSRKVLNIVQGAFFCVMAALGVFFGMVAIWLLVLIMIALLS